MVIKNNMVGSEGVSSATVSKEYNIELNAGGDSANTDCLSVQGLPRIAVQVKSRDNTVQIVAITVQGAIAQRS